MKMDITDEKVQYTITKYYGPMSEGDRSHYFIIQHYYNLLIGENAGNNLSKYGVYYFTGNCHLILESISTPTQF